jgi:hypothetical protein
MAFVKGMSEVLIAYKARNASTRITLKKKT